MHALPTHIFLKYNSEEFKYEQFTLIPKSERCALSQKKISTLFKKNIDQGFPHVLALVHDVGNGQDVYDANLLLFK